MHTISQSEVDSFKNCKRKHYYSFGEKLEPKKHSDSLTRGTLGHKALDAFYSHLKEFPGDWEQAAYIGTQAILEKVTADNTQLIMKLQTLLTKYFMHAQETQDYYEILAVEHEFRYTIPGTKLVIPFTPDLIWRNKYTGKVYVVDHKFLFNFYSENAIAISPQLAKYVGLLRLMGYDVEDAQYNMIRHRELKEGSKLFSLQRCNLGDRKVKTYVEDQIVAMGEIADIKELPLDRWEQIATRTASSFNCEHCPMLELCLIDLNGGNRDLMIRTYYQPNTYGYANLEPAVKD